MRISIAMCTYNGAQYLQQQLNSFAKQTHTPFELIICDDGSTDPTLAIIERFAKDATFPVRLFRNECNLGSTKNFEKAIGLCVGDLIALADQDDEWYSDKLFEFNRLFEKLPGALAAFGNADLFDEYSISLGGSLWNRVFFSPPKNASQADAEIISALLRLNNVATGCTMVFRSQFRNEILPIPNSWVHDGWIAWLAALRGGLAAFPKPEIRYRIHSHQQVGLRPSSVTGHLNYTRKYGLIGFLSLIEQYHDLKLYLQKYEQGSRMGSYIPRIDAKLRHIKARAALADFSFLGRVRWILPSWREYHHYARGPISMLKDIFFVSTRVSP